ncbi:proton-coupled zinc antiporter SLC30A5-like [Oscarella lobularis]|uniref:proton-coupled zinc antiporter SLC30A5-like n=1 Tax=Oscarella lobularis TaxID=121494 RepID=UPI003314483C
MDESPHITRKNPSRVTPYSIVLIIVKCLSCFGLFLCYDLLQLVPVALLLFLATLGSSILLLPLQKPFSSGKRLSLRAWFRIAKYTVLGLIVSLIWIFGLKMCGPLRGVLLFQHSDIVILGIISLFTQGGPSIPGRFRGAVLFFLGLVTLMLFDNDALNPTDHPEGKHSSDLTHGFYLALSWLGVPDHKGGIILLFCGLCLSVAHKSVARKLAVAVGGAKRLNALSTLVTCLLLSPWAVVTLMSSEELSFSWTDVALPLLAVIIFTFILDFYVESVCSAKLESAHLHKLGTIASFTSALVLSFIWNHPDFPSKSMSSVTMHHALSPGVIVAYILFVLATRLLTRASSIRSASGSKGNLIGYTAAGLPLYNFTGTRGMLQKHSQSILAAFKSNLRQILEGEDSRHIFYFLCMNLTFTVVELLYGIWTNSLGLISDGFHMLFDCTALVVGLYAAVIARWKSTRTFSYGYGRVEVLSGFANGLFLVVIAFAVFSEGLSRLIDPPLVSTDRLLFVSVAGFVVNLIGIAAFSHAHSHASSGHGHSHAHKHGGSTCDGHGHGKNANMQGVFLHILADTLGSVGVIVSSVCIEQFGWYIADPICSVFISVLIFLSVVPLLKNALVTLLQGTPPEVRGPLQDLLAKIRGVPGVIGIRDVHVWRHSSSLQAGTIHVQVEDEVNEQRIMNQITALLKECGIGNTAVQIEKEAFYQSVSPVISSKYRFLTDSTLSPHIYVDFGPHARELNALSL